ncbi:MAG: PAS domain S-box protein [Candidatus Cloacimonetes bacterium]|nr:PAS domain S-box protein [Candidatus Cloacimonadota bacterium]
MKKKIKILIFSDDIVVAKIIQDELIAHQLYFSYLRVEKEEELINAIQDFQPDIILSDFMLSNIKGSEALGIATKFVPETPFIFVTDMLSEEIVVESIKKGAWDYVIKERLFRLVPAIKNVLNLKQEKEKSKHVLEALQDSEERMKAIFKNALDVIVIVDFKTGKIMEVNDAASKVLGYKAKELIGQEFSVFFPPDDNRKRKDLQQEAEIYNAVLEAQAFQRADGSICPIDLTVKGIPWNGKDVAMVTLRDVTERKQAEKELKSGRERLKMLNKIIRHDLANDFIVIKSAVNLFRRQSKANMLEEIEKRVDRSLKTIESYKNFELFIESNAALNEIELIDFLNDIIVEFPQIDFNIKGNCKIFGDDALYSIFTNLISNSIKHGHSSKIDIIMTSEINVCRIKFMDNGKGIPDDIKSKIFGEGYSYGDYGRAGVGLHIVKKIVERYGGYISVEDNKPKGVAFIINLRKTLND